MNPNSCFNFFTVQIFTLIWIFFGFDALAQESTTGLNPMPMNYPHVEWVKKWPTGEKHHSKSFRADVNSILFGIKQPEIDNPVSILAYNPAEFWIIDQGNKTIFNIQNDVGHIPHSIAKTKFDLSSLVGICSGPNSSILFTDSHSCKVYRFSPDEKKLEIMNDTLVLEQPTGIAYSPSRKEIWVLETKAHRIAVLNENGGLIRRIGIRGDAPGEFNYPTHIWIDKKDYIYITDALNFRIQVLNADGEVISVFGEAGDATGYLARPKGIATDSYGNIYIVDALFHVVQVFDLKGTFLYKFGTQGQGNSEFWMPTGIYIDKQDYIYVADSYNSRVQIFQLAHTDKK
ncbi:MAG: 6-bladed beta-propeller [Bacteroidales bacterium]